MNNFVKRLWFAVKGISFGGDICGDEEGKVIYWIRSLALTGIGFFRGWMDFTVSVWIEYTWKIFAVKFMIDMMDY